VRTATSFITFPWQ